MKLYVNRFTDVIIAIKGFTMPGNLGTWLMSYPKWYAPSTRKNWLKELEEFIKGTFTAYVGERGSVKKELMLNEILRLYRLESRTSRTRRHVVNHAGAASLPSRDDIMMGL